MMTPATDTLATIEWLGMRLRVPGDWHIVKHSTDPRRGRLAFVDRRRQRLLVAWSPCDGAPDWDRMLDDQAALERERFTDATFERVPDWFGWHLLRRRCEEGGLLRAARYDRPRGRVIEVVMPLDEPDDTLDESLVLKTFEPEAFDEEAGNAFRAFDVAVNPPAGWTLKAVAAQLGRVDVTLANGRAELIVRRLGMASSWFKGDVALMLKRELKSDRIEYRDLMHAGRQASLARSREVGPRIKSFVGRLRERIDLAWHDARANAVMHVTLFQPRGMNLDLTALDIRCLDALNPDA